MPPRFAYWTILIDNTPTAFRAHDAQDLMPTLAQLKRTNPNVVMKWFARGRLWGSQEEERAAWRAPKIAAEKRSRDWRPGGQHKDPRDRFKKKNRPLGPPREAKPWRDKPAGARPSDRPWQTKPTGPRKDRKPWTPARPPRGAHPWSAKSSGPPRGNRPWQKRPGPRGPRNDEPDRD